MMSGSAFCVMLLALTTPVGLPACAASRSGPAPARQGASAAIETVPVDAPEPRAASKVPSWTLVALGIRGRTGRIATDAGRFRCSMRMVWRQRQRITSNS